MQFIVNQAFFVSFLVKLVFEIDLSLRWCPSPEDHLTNLCQQEIRIVKDN